MIVLEKLAAFFAGPIGRWIVLAALVASALFAGGVYERSIGYREGLRVGDERLAAQAKANANAVIALDAKYRGEEAAHKKDVEQIRNDYESKLAENRKEGAAAIAAARAGGERLYVRTHCPSPHGSTSPEARSDPAGATETLTQLPDEVTANLWSLAYDANEVVIELNSCIDLLEADRKLKGTQ